MTIKEIRAKYGSRCDYIVVDASGWAWDGFNEDHWNAIGELGWCASDADPAKLKEAKFHIVAVPTQSDYGKLRTCAYYPINVVEYDADGIVYIYTANDFM